MMSKNPKGEAVVGGHVVRLHFACRASLPIGSSLRVTGSSLWTPSFLNNSNGINNNAAIITQEQSKYMNQDEETAYSSSMDMVTDPDSYPLWYTRKPIVITLFPNQSVGGLHLHRYRYLVVTPGANNEDREHDYSGSFKGNNNNYNSLSNDIPVVLWEDPFTSQPIPNITSSTATNTVRKVGSNISLCSFASYGAISNNPMTATNLLTLPYRTLDISTKDGKLMNQDDSSQGCEMTKDGVRVDKWNARDDVAWLSYLEREDQVRKLRMKRVEDDNLERSRSLSDASSTQSSDLSTMENMMYGTSMADNDNGSDNGAKQSTPATPAVKKKERLFLVCYHLPIRLSYNSSSKTWSATWSESLLAKSKKSWAARSYVTHWIGTVFHPSIESQSDKEDIERLLQGMNCTPLFIEKKTAEAHYLGMCKQVLWPAFHNIDLLELSSNKDIPKGKSEWDQSRLDTWWNAYTSVNSTFATCIQKMLLQPGDTLWVHDYHLALLPTLIHEQEIRDNQQRRTKMVFFLHIPFPTSQIFRELEHGESILEGMLHADVVGFHAFDHARHFLAAAKRILGLNYETLTGGLIGIKYERRTVLVTLSNVSIEPDKVDEALALQSLTNESNAIKDKYPNRMLICGVDVAQRLSGVNFKFLAYERLLTDYPIWHHKVTLVQKLLVPNSRKVDEVTTLRELRYLARRITDKFGTHCMDYEEVTGASTLPLERRCALWTACDVFCSTPVREGLNLYPVEFIYAKKEPSKAGVTIASEFSAVCSILNGALRVNPFDIQMMASSMDKALGMEDVEREGRRSRDIDFVASCPSSKWSKHVLRDLNEATLLDADSAANNDLTGKEAELCTATFLANETERNFSRVNMDDINAAYHSTTKRVLIIDFNGTLVNKECHGKYLKREILGSSGFKPPPMVIKALTKLCNDPQNIVFVVSGDAQENIEKAIGSIPNLYLAASNGACFALPTTTTPFQPQQEPQPRKWHSLDLGVNWKSMKQTALPILSKYTARTNGSFVKLTHSSIGWSYYSTDPEWGLMQASQLILELQNLNICERFGVRLVILKGVVEIVPDTLNKGLIVKKVLREVASRNGGDGVDFVLCMGDDVSDEKMFTSVYSFISEMDEEYCNVIPSPPVIQENNDNNKHNTLFMKETPSVKCKKTNPMYAFTVAVGKKATSAAQYVDDARDVATLLIGLAGLQEEYNEKEVLGNRNIGGIIRGMSFDDDEQRANDFFK